MSLKGAKSLVLPLEKDDSTVEHGNNVYLTENASAIVQSALGYQAKANDPRLNRPSTAQGSEGGLNKFKNLGRAQTVVAQRKAKKEEINLLGVGIKVWATLWKITQGNGKMTQVWILYYS